MVSGNLYPSPRFAAAAAMMQKTKLDHGDDECGIHEEETEPESHEGEQEPEEAEDEERLLS